MNDYFWVIGGGLLQVPLIHEVRTLGYRTIVTDGSEGCAARRHADLFLPIDIFDIAGHLEAADRIVAGDERIAGVLAAGIDAPETMARLATYLGLPTVNPEIAHIVNHKDQFRQRLEQLGYPVPRYRVLDDIADVPDAVQEIGYPLIVKNTSSSGSRGTRLFHEPDLDTVTRTAEIAMNVSRSGRALIEEVWEGPEQTVETLFDVNGVFHPCFITDRIFDKSGGYALEVELRHPTRLPADTQREMFELAESVARAFGVTIGAAKFDMLLTGQGPRIVEMTVRLSGGFDCQYLVPAATGKSVLRAAALTAVGQPFPPELLEDRKHRVALSGSLWPQPGRITSISGIEEARSVPGFEHIFFRQAVGDVVEPYVDCTRRVCFIIVSGQTEEEARASMEAVKERIQVLTVPHRSAA